jgi:nucleotide-binding universal stress UspA family protein
MMTADASGTTGGAFTSILVPVDGSPEAERAIICAAQFDVDRIVLLRVDPGDPVDADAPEADIYAQWLRQHHASLVSYLDGLASAHAGAAGKITTTVRYGDPAEEIIAEARDHDFVVMSSSGKGAAGRLLFGSTADRVTRHSTTPVLVMRTGEDGASAGPAERLVVPLDGSELAERALPIAGKIARMLSAPIHLVRSVGMDEVLATVKAAREASDHSLFETDDDPYETARKRTDEEAARYLERVRARLQATGGLTVTTELLGGTAAFELLWAVNEKDIVVMTSRGEGGVQRWLVGSVADKMVREAKAPVLLVPIGRPHGDAGA